VADSKLNLRDLLLGATVSSSDFVVGLDEISSVDDPEDRLRRLMSLLRDVGQKNPMVASLLKDGGVAALKSYATEIPNFKVSGSRSGHPQDGVCMPLIDQRFK
jgi:hypothetical protein